MLSASLNKTLLLPRKEGDARRCSKVHPVQTLDFQTTISKLCLQHGDEWADIVKGRLEFVFDLPAADAVYHQTTATEVLFLR